MNSEDDYALLEDYLDGILSAAERKSLQARLDADPALANNLRLLQRLRQQVTDLPAAQSFEQKLSEKLRRAGEAHFGERQPAPVVRLLARPAARWALAASVVGLICLAGWLFFSNQSLSDEQLTARFFEPPQALGVYRSGEDGQATMEPQVILRQQVDSLYRLGNFAAALVLMNQLEGNFQGQPSSGFYFQRGVLHLLAGQPRQALADFEGVQNGHSNDKNWYAAWATLQAGERAAAMEMFEKIAASESPWRAQAGAVLKASVKSRF